MRVFCYFDLPVLSASNRRDYRKFRKWLVKSGFVMLQESVYSKLCLNLTAANFVIDNVRRNHPPSGNVMLTTVTERQFANTVYVIGQPDNEYVTSTDRLIVL